MASKENYRTVKDILAKRRARALEKAEQNRVFFHSQAPEAVEIDRALSQTAMQLFGIAIMANSPEKEAKLSALKAQNLSLQEAREELLASLGLPKNFTEPQYECPLCGDSGYIDLQMCRCMKHLLALEGFKTSGIGHLIGTQTFDNFSLDYYKGADREQMKRNLSITRSFAENFSSKSGNLLFMGATGLGKTHLSTAIATVVIEKGYDVLYESAQNIIGVYEHERFHSTRGEDNHESERYETCDLLIIDDLGTEFQTAFSVSCLYNLINTRLNRGKSTIISTNLTAGEIRARYDDRISSRLLGHFMPLLFRGEDVRCQKL